MNTPTKKPMPKTADQILDLAETLIQTRGYSAFSYQDIATELNITKASIHYHYKSKTDLGLAVIDRYSSRFETALAEVIEDNNKSSLALFDFYTTPFLKFAKTPDRVCLCGALAGEMLSLPQEIRQRTDSFFKSHQTWLTRILERGVKRKEVKLTSSPTKTARLMFGALQGGLLVKRTTGDTTQLKDVIEALKSLIFE